MPSFRAHSRPEGLFPRAVNQRNAYLRIVRDSSALRQGRGGRIFARAFARFRMEDSYDGIEASSLPPSTYVLAELPATLRSI